MNNLKKTKELLTRYIIARIPFLNISSIERNRSLDILQEISEKLGIEFYVHTLSKGIYELSSGKVINTEKTIYGAIDFITEQFRYKSNITYIFTEIPDISTENNDSKQFLDLVTLAEEKGGMIITITTNQIWGHLQRLGMNTDIPLPDEEEMFNIISDYIEDYRKEIPIDWQEDEIKEAANILAGLTRMEVYNIIASLIANKKITKQDLDEIRFIKDKLFSDISGLEKIDNSTYNSEVGGLSGLKQWLNEKKELLVTSNREEMQKRGLQPPRGIMLVGVPGCGKSLSAKAIAAEWKLPLYRLDFATVQGSYVGQSEHQLREALKTAEQVSPCVLWIDEIEKGLSGASQSNDGGVSARMVGQFLFWLQECKKQVFVVATANDVSKLPSELLRRGRFDELFFVDLPTSTERKEIILMYFKKYLDFKLQEDLLNKLIELTEGFTGADLESTVRDIAYRNIVIGIEALSNNNIINSFTNVVPLSQTSPERIEAIRAWGKERAVPASGNPIGQEGLKKKPNLKGRRVLV